MLAILSGVKGKVSRIVNQPMTTREKILEGMRRAAEKGRFPGRPQKVPDAQIRAAMHLGASAGGRKVGLTPSQFRRRRRKLEMEELQNDR